MKILHILSRFKAEGKYKLETARLRQLQKRKATVEVVPEQRCSGCGGCKNVCPADAVRLEENELGYLFPRVDKEKCINCGLCLKRCPGVQKSVTDSQEPPKVYAVWAQDTVRKVSSSGGMFTLLAQRILEQNGMVFGAAFTKDWEVAHIGIENQEELSKLRGAKYVQSDTGFVYRRVKEALTAGRSVLFTGCPCQVSALRSFLGKEYPQLLTADLVCHGVPSRMVYRKYLEEVYGKDNIESFSFRTKEKGYSCTVLEVKLKGGKTFYPSLKDKDPYEKVFHGSYALRKSCINCKFAELPRQGDFTIGDYWGVSLYDEKLNDGKGTSVVLVNNKKGEQVLEEIRNEAKLIRETPLEAAKRKNRFGAYVPVPKARDEFLAETAKNGFSKAVKKYLK